MVRVATALIAAMSLPGSAVALEPIQETPSGTHTVIDYDTLWDLAQQYLSDPWAWDRIWEANRDQVDDPDLILPGWILVIPGLEGRVREIVVEPGQVPVPRQVTLAEVRTVFYRDTSALRESVEALATIEYPAVPRDGVYSAPWMIPLFTEPDHLGTLVGPASAGSRAAIVRAYERVRVTVGDEIPRVGDLLQVYRVDRSIPEVAQVVQPTGIITVSELSADGVIGIVTKEFARMTPGDFVRPMPAYTIEPGQQPGAISGGSEAVILGFASRAELHDLGGIAFLDLGSDDGVGVGDVFELFDRVAGAGVTRGALQVIGVSPDGSAARIVQMDGAVFDPGVVVQLTRKMR